MAPDLDKPLQALSPLAVDLETVNVCSLRRVGGITLSERVLQEPYIPQIDSFGKRERAIEADPDCDSPDGVR